MKVVTLDASTLTNWGLFHKYFQETFGFPDYYGNNLDAWIDCMTDYRELVVLHVLNIDSLVLKAPEIYQALIECSAFVNYRNIESGGQPAIILSFNKQ